MIKEIFNSFCMVFKLKASLYVEFSPNFLLIPLEHKKQCISAGLDLMSWHQLSV